MNGEHSIEYINFMYAIGLCLFDTFLTKRQYSSTKIPTLTKIFWKWSSDTVGIILILQLFIMLRLIGLALTCNTNYMHSLSFYYVIIYKQQLLYSDWFKNMSINPKPVQLHQGKKVKLSAKKAK